MRLSTKTIEAFIKAGGENYKHINKDKELVEKYTQHILNIADKAYKNPLKQILKCVFGNFLRLTLKRIFLCFKYKRNKSFIRKKRRINVNW